MSAYREIWGLKLLTTRQGESGESKTEMTTLESLGLMVKSHAESTAEYLNRDAKSGDVVVIYNAESV